MNYSLSCGGMVGRFGDRGDAFPGNDRHASWGGT